MATADDIQDLAEKLVSELDTAEGGGAFSQIFTPVFSWFVKTELEDLADGFNVSVVPVEDERELEDRDTFTSTWAVTIFVQTHVTDDGSGPSAVSALAREIREWVEANAAPLTLDGGTLCRLVGSRRVVMARRHLENKRVATSGVNLSYYVGG